MREAGNGLADSDYFVDLRKCCAFSHPGKYQFVLLILSHYSKF
jgi:hypothetical protein